MIERTNLWRQIQFEEWAAAAVNTTAMSAHLGLFQCPSSTAQAPSSYVACFGRGDPLLAPGQGDGVFFRNSRIRVRDIEDGAMTFLLGERRGTQWGADWSNVYGRAPVGPGSGADPALVLGHTGPVAGAIHPLKGSPGCSADFGSQHPGGTHFLLLDGSVRFVSDHIDAGVYAALATRTGREAVTGADF